jgi:hypothetical protein
LNLSRSGVSTSIGVKGAHVTVGHGQTRTTVGIPGSGLSYTHVESNNSAEHATAPPETVATPSAARGWLWIALIVIVVSMLVYRSSHAVGPSPANSKVSSSAPATDDQRGTQAQPLVVTKPDNERSAAEATEADHSRNERDTTRATVVLAIFTVLLWAANIWLIIETKRVSAKQAADTKRAIDEAGRSANAMQSVAEATRNNAVLMSGMLSKQMRAYLSVEGGSAVYQDAHLRFEAMPVIVNNGLTPAKNVCFKALSDILDGSHDPPTIAEIGPLIVNDLGMAPRQRLTIRSAVRDRVPDTDVEAIMRGGSRRLFAWGRVTYEDVYGGRWFTNFFMSYYFLKNADGTFQVGVNYSPAHNDFT